MPKCKKCNNHFPNRIKVDGKTKNLYKRKYCLSCSPYKNHNTKKLELDKTLKSGNLTICSICGRKYKYDRSLGHNKEVCNSCLVLRRKKKIKERAVTYKGSKCASCGYNRCSDALSFHHLNADDKDFSISGNYNKSWKIVKKELDKCILLCLNCHAEKHYDARLAE